MEKEKTIKGKGGKLFITISQSGEVETHEGWLAAKEARKARAQAAKAECEADSETAKNARPEVTSSLQTYIDLHRHAAVRAVLTDHPGVALRLMIAHAVTGSRSEEHTSELQSLMRISYAVFCLNKKKQTCTQRIQLIVTLCAIHTINQNEQ